MSADGAPVVTRELDTGTETLLASVEDGIATVLLNRPDRLNAIIPEMQRAYADVMGRLDADPDVKVVVVTGAGRGFCAGADTARLAEGGEVLRSFGHTVGILPSSVALAMRKPVVAAVNGPTVGIGFALMLGCDVRFVANEAVIGTAFSRLGLTAEYGVGWLLPRAVGHARAAELLLSGRSIDGVEAARIGLATESVSAVNLLHHAYAWARDVADSCAPWSLAAIKRQLWDDADLPREEAFQRSVDVMLESFGRPDLPEALAARTEKRRPRFQPLD